MSVGIIAGNTASINMVNATFDAASVAAATTVEQTITVPGVKVGDVVVVSKSDLDAGLLYGTARVSAADTVSLQIANVTAGAIDAASETVVVTVIRPEGDSPATGLTV